MTKHPMQPRIVVDGSLRFQENPIVQFLFETSVFDMNHLLGIRRFSMEDHEQFLQLLGYEVGEFLDCDLRVTPETIKAVNAEYLVWLANKLRVT